MKTARSIGFLPIALALILLPSLALAEVSVQLDPHGRFRRLVYLTKGTGASRVVWGQVRRGVPLDRMLNPLGDNLGDLPPRIVFNPLTGAPWVFWSMNIANQKRLGYSHWNGTGWSAPAPVVASPGPYYYDELDPSVTFVQGTPYLVWWSAAPTAKVYFSTLVSGVWSPPALLSDPAIDSRKPIITVAGAKAAATATVDFQTPFGPSVTIYDAAALFLGAASLMDTPIPPGQTDDPDSGNTGSGGKLPPHNRQ